ncbi:MAG: hypothetical protein WC314_11845 [Vulcanimicrobiota bacterium]
MKDKDDSSSILILGHGSHPVLGSLYQQLMERGKRRVVFISLESFPQDVSLSYHQLPDGLEGRIGLLEEEPIEFADLVSVVLDDYQIVSPAEGLSEEDFEYRNTESWAALRGLFQCLSEQTLVVNHLPEKEHFDSRIGELSLLDSYGLRVPRLMVTNEPDRARQFFEEVGQVMYRPVQGKDMPFSKMAAEDLERLEELRLSPVHFEEVPQGRLASVVKVGDSLYLNPRELELPSEIEQGFRRLSEEQGLQLAEIRLCQSAEESPWMVLGLSPFLTEAGLEDPEATEAVLRMLEFGETNV